MSSGLQWLRDVDMHHYCSHQAAVCFIFNNRCNFLITVPGLIGGGRIKTTFFPFIEGDNIAVNLALKSGTRAEITKEKIDRIEKVVWEVNEEFNDKRDDTLQTIIAIDKRGSATHVATSNIQLLDGENRGGRVLISQVEFVKR